MGCFQRVSFAMCQSGVFFKVASCTDGELNLARFAVTLVQAIVCVLP